jgi:hypothetical protein
MHTQVGLDDGEAEVQICVEKRMNDYGALVRYRMAPKANDLNNIDRAMARRKGTFTFVARLVLQYTVVSDTCVALRNLLIVNCRLVRAIKPQQPCPETYVSWGMLLFPLTAICVHKPCYGSATVSKISSVPSTALRHFHSES